MNDPALYHKSHKSTKQKAGNIIGKYLPKLQWRPDGKDTLLDVGSGTGDVLMDYIYPLMPKSFSKIVCTDISPDMVAFAEKYYNSMKKCEFRTLDIAANEELSPDLHGEFDHVTSTLCLHWVQDYRTALKNIFNLIRPEGGDCLLIFMSSHTIFDAYIYASKHTKWSEHLKNANRCISPLHYSTDAKTEFSSLMKETGFDDISIEVEVNTVNFGSVDNFKENIRSVCGVLDSIPELQHSEFLDDFVAIMAEFMPKNKDINDNTFQYSMKYDLFVAYGKKQVLNL